MLEKKVGMFEGVWWENEVIGAIEVHGVAGAEGRPEWVSRGRQASMLREVLTLGATGLFLHF